MFKRFLTAVFAALASITFLTTHLSAQTTGRSEEEQRTIRAYKKVSEAVVFIVTKSISVDPFELFPQQRVSEGSGSGIIVDAKRGTIITNLHVIQDATKIEISLADGSSYPGKLVGYDRELDIAVLQLRGLPEHPLVAAEFADSAKLDVGQTVLAIGNPFGLNRTLTRGIISSLERAVKTPQGVLMKGLIQTDAAINPGNSGGALLDLDGKLIGMNTAILSQSGDSAGIGFAVPVNQIRRVLPELVATGKVLRPKLGWILDDTNQGPVVRWTEKDGPAEKAGVEGAYRIVSDVFLRGYVIDYTRADLIVSINGKNVRTKDEVEDLISRTEPGEPLHIKLRRGGGRGRERDVEIVPELR